MIRNAFFSTCILVMSQLSYGHCQIPCGLYDDETKSKELMLDVQTIEKAVKQIESLSKEKNKNFNQLTRWINNKEDHATNIMDNLNHYYLAQRVKAPTKKDKKLRGVYLRKLELAHRVIASAMKAKQGANMKDAQMLKKNLEAFVAYYKEHHH